MPIGDDFYKKLLANFKKGLGYEANNDYTKINDTIPKGQKKPLSPEKQALGKYQFVPEYHWKDIKAFGAKNNMPVTTYEDFLNQPMLQEEFFESYFQKQVFPFVEKNKGKTKNMSADELAYYYHHEGPGGTQNYIKTGKLREETSINPSGEVFMKGYTNRRDQDGGEAVYGFTNGYVDKKYKEFNAELDAINKNPNKLSDELLNEKRIQTQIKYQKEGLRPYFNRIIQEKNKITELKGADKKAVLETINGIFENEDYLTSETVAAAKKSGTIQMLINKDDIKNIWDKPEFAQYRKYFTNNSKNQYRLDIPLKNDKNNILNTFENDVKSVPGNENYSIYNDKGQIMQAMAWYNRPQDFDGKAIDVNDKGRVIHNNWNENTKMSIPDFQSPKIIKTVYNIPLLADIAIVEETVEEKTKAETKTDTPPEPVNPAQPTSTEMDKWIAYDKQKKNEEKKKAEDDVLSSYFQTERDETQVADPNAKKKDTFPYADILSQAAGTIAGLSMANEKINYRDEQVNDDFRNYTAELSKLSKMGLRPEEESYAKRMLTEAYQGSVNNIVQNSNGNRNTVLGNLGRVDAQRNKGLMDIALADATAKNEAFYKYGEAMKYINEFDSQRDIANNERKYQNILATKQAGAELAGASMSAFIDTIHNYQDNKPGSWNDNYKSHMSKRHFGVDVTLKDDGSGKPYTASGKAKQDNEILSKNKEFNQYREMFSQLSPEKQQEINGHFRQNQGDIKSTYGLIDAARNPDNSNNPKNPGYANMFKTDKTITDSPFSTEPTPVLNTANTQPPSLSTEPISGQDRNVENNQLVPDILSGKMAPYQQPVIAQAEPTEKEKAVNLIKQAKGIVSDTFDKVNKGIIGSDNSKIILDKLLESAGKTF